jgi:hypothetical protein
MAFLAAASTSGVTLSLLVQINGFMRRARAPNERKSPSLNGVRSRRRADFWPHAAGPGLVTHTGEETAGFASTLLTETPRRYSAVLCFPSQPLACHPVRLKLSSMGGSS